MKIRATITTDGLTRELVRVYEAGSHTDRMSEDHSVVEHVFRDPTISEFTVVRTRNDGSFWSSVRYERIDR